MNGKLLYLAICRNRSGHVFIDQFFYETEEQAREWLEESFLKLWKDGPSLTVKDTYNPPRRKIKEAFKNEKGDNPPQEVLEFARFMGGKITD